MNNKDNKEFSEFQEFKQWQAEKEKNKFRYCPSPLLKTKFGKILCVGLLLAVLVSIIVVGICQVLPKENPYQLSEQEKFLIGKWEIYDIGFANALPIDGNKAYTTDPVLTELWEMAQFYGFIFDGTFVDSNGDTPIKNSKDVFLRARGNTSRVWGMETNPEDELLNRHSYGVAARWLRGNSLSFTFTHNPSDKNAYDNLWYNDSLLYFNNYYSYGNQEFGYTQYCPINSVVVGRRAQAINERDTIKMTLIPFESTDRILWYEFAKNSSVSQRVSE